MFIRKKKNKSGSVSVQIISKSNGYKVANTAGCAKTPEDNQHLTNKAKHMIGTCNEK